MPKHKNISEITDNLADAEAMLLALQSMFAGAVELNPAQAAGVSLIMDGIRNKILIAEGLV